VWQATCRLLNLFSDHIRYYETKITRKQDYLYHAPWEDLVIHSKILIKKGLKYSLQTFKSEIMLPLLTLIMLLNFSNACFPSLLKQYMIFCYTLLKMVRLNGEILTAFWNGFVSVLRSAGLEKNCSSAALVGVNFILAMWQFLLVIIIKILHFMPAEGQKTVIWYKHTCLMALVFLFLYLFRFSLCPMWPQIQNKRGFLQSCKVSHKR
jgi:hypothetical protein